MDRRWKRNSVSLVSSVTTVMRLLLLLLLLLLLQTNNCGDAQCEVRQLTDDEDGHDDYEDKRDVLAMSGPATGRGRRRHLLMSATRGVKRLDEEHVQNEQRHEWTDAAEHQVAGQLVDDEVDLVVSQRRVHHLSVTLQRYDTIRYDTIRSEMFDSADT